VNALENRGRDLTRESLVEGTEAIRIRAENGRWVEFGEPINFESTPGKVIAARGWESPSMPAKVVRQLRR
jgi:hypothetical protein